MVPNPQSHETVNQDFQVAITASGLDPRDATCQQYVHAITVSQPVQSFTVIREYGDFVNVASALKLIIANIPALPAMSCGIAGGRQGLQAWLTHVLHVPGVRESPAIRQFLTGGANQVPPQFESVNWLRVEESELMQQQQQGNSSHDHYDHNTSLDDMEMDEMFDTGGGGSSEEEDDDEFDDSDNDNDEALPYSVRYPAPDATLTKEDTMEMIDAEVEMIEDIGSLAQSMGASHLGRSLQLQAEIEKYKQPLPQAASNNQFNSSISVGGLASLHKTGAPGGGIGNAVENARIDGVGDSFNQRAPVSAPRLDSFKMIKVIGKGSFGKVFLVREIKTGEMFALKVLKKDNIIKRNQVEHTRTERNVLGYVKHPFIVGLNMAFQSKDKLYFVLDYCAGGELFFHLGKLGKFPEPRACFYAAEITLAIEYVHNLDIIYRDLKPENVLLDAKGHVRLTDFGLSKEGISNSSSGANSFCGTPEYLAPEILNRQGHGRAVDWWSLGALLYEMLTGLPPFYCRDREKLFEKIRKAQLLYPRHLSARAQNLLRGLLTRDPTKRLGSGDQDAEAIKSHPFFSEIDWPRLANGDVPPPWDPQISGSLDTSQFDHEFTSMPIFSPSSHQRGAAFPASMSKDDNVFEGFTFTDNKFMHPNMTAKNNS